MAEFINGVHKVTAEYIVGLIRLRFFENMGGRWVELGSAEDWQPEDGLAYIADFVAAD